MPGHQCYHCKQWVEKGKPHDCWTTTEGALTQDLSEDLKDAWERLRDTAVSLGDQRIYASHHSIMFSRKSCYFFVRPKKSHLEVCIFLHRPVKAPQVRRAERVSKAKVAHMIRIEHRDQVEAPITNWLQEAYVAAEAPAPAKRPQRAPRKTTRPKPRMAAKARNRAARKRARGRP